MAWWKNNQNQKIADRARKARMERLSGERGREKYGLSSEKVVSEKEGGGKNMIKVTRLNGEVLYLNILQIESMETIPETKIKMMNGYYVLVKDPADSVLDQIREFMGSCFTFAGQGK